MIIKDLDKVFKMLDGRNMKVNIAGDEQGSLGGQKVEIRNLTLREVMSNSLLAPLPQGRGNPQAEIDGDEKARRCYLAQEIYGTKKQEIELNVDDVTLIKKEIGRVYPQLIVGQAYKLIDPPKGS